jgi:hypothetical protein
MKPKKDSEHSKTEKPDAIEFRKEAKIYNFPPLSQNGMRI